MAAEAREWNAAFRVLKLRPVYVKLLSQELPVLPVGICGVKGGADPLTDGQGDFKGPWPCLGGDGTVRLREKGNHSLFILVARQKVRDVRVIWCKKFLLLNVKTRTRTLQSIDEKLPERLIKQALKSNQELFSAVKEPINRPHDCPHTTPSLSATHLHYRRVDL